MNIVDGKKTEKRGQATFFKMGGRFLLGKAACPLFHWGVSEKIVSVPIKIVAVPIK